MRGVGGEWRRTTPMRVIIHLYLHVDVVAMLLLILAAIHML